ncbi:MAG TPA: hypothetical protein VF167_18495 [Longimicrobiaceae bacterium]
MRSTVTILLLLTSLVVGGCSDSTGPQTFSISGTWTSVGFAGADFSMTVVETARAVEGAGYRITGGQATAYRVFGANAGQRASLLLDFDDQEDINFEGTFERQENATVLEGLLFGGGYSGAPITFQREEN